MYISGKLKTRGDTVYINGIAKHKTVSLSQQSYYGYYEYYYYDTDYERWRDEWSWYWGINPDYSGTYIGASKPVAVFVATVWAQMMNKYYDAFLTQLLPATSWGTEFVAVGTPERTKNHQLRLISGTASSYDVMDPVNSVSATFGPMTWVHTQLAPSGKRIFLTDPAMQVL